jgi:L-alanine-DL-glutamate epimerase-like enolase superfamily enzyme
VSARLNKITIHDLTDQVGPGDDGAFIAAHADGCVGWYGPVASDVADFVNVNLAGALAGWEVTDHRLLLTMMEDCVDPTDKALASWAVGAVDCAIWDLHGQLVDAPVAALLSESPPVATVPLYASWLRLDLAIPDNIVIAAKVAGAGWAFTKWGLRQGTIAKPAAEADRLRRLADTLTSALGQDAAFDAVFTWDTELLDAFASRADGTPLLWIEDPLCATDHAAYRRHWPTTLPISFGERLHLWESHEDVLALRPAGLILDVVGCGGLTRSLALTAAAADAGVRVFPHGRSFIPGVHLAAAFPSRVGAVEFRLRWEPLRQLLYRDSWRPQRGQIALPTTPGLGTTPRRR